MGQLLAVCSPASRRATKKLSRVPRRAAPDNEALALADQAAFKRAGDRFIRQMDDAVDAADAAAEAGNPPPRFIWELPVEVPKTGKRRKIRRRRRS